MYYSIVYRLGQVVSCYLNFSPSAILHFFPHSLALSIITNNNNYAIFITNSLPKSTRLGAFVLLKFLCLVLVSHAVPLWKRSRKCTHLTPPSTFSPFHFSLTKNTKSSRQTNYSTKLGERNDDGRAECSSWSNQFKYPTRPHSLSPHPTKPNFYFLQTNIHSHLHSW